MSGSYLVAEDGGPRNRTGGVSASLSSPDGHVLGGALATLIAAGPVQVYLKKLQNHCSCMEAIATVE